MANLITQVPIPNTPMVSKTGVPVKAWFDFFTTLWLRTGGTNNNVSLQLDQIGAIRGGMLARFVSEWLEFEATVTNTIPVMNPGADVQLFTASQVIELALSITNAALNIGSPGAANSPSINFFSSGLAPNYDVRVVATGGSAINGNGALTLDGTLVIAPIGINKGLQITQAPTGTTAGPVALNQITITPDTVITDSTSFVIGLNVGMQFGGAGVIGGREAIQGYAELNAATDALNGNRNYVGIQGIGTATHDDGGTNTGAGALGAIFGGSWFGYGQNGATNLLHVAGGEIDFALQTGSSAKHKTGILLCNHTTDAVQGATTDAGYVLSAQANFGLNHGFLVSDISGFLPIKSTGTIFGTTTGGSAAHGIDLSGYTFSTDAFKSTGFVVDGTGKTTFSNATASSSQTTGAVLISAGGLGVSGDIWAAHAFLNAAQPQVLLAVANVGKGGFQYLASTGVLIDTYQAEPFIFRYNSTESLRVTNLSVILNNGTAIPAGGTAGLGYRFSSTSNFGVFFGSGAPSLAAAKGSLYLRSDGSATNNRAYINTDGATTWTALTTAA